MNIDKTVTDVFDFIASNIGKLTSSSSPTLPDLSWVDVDKLLPRKDTLTPELFYAPLRYAPDIDFKITTQLPFIDILDGSFESAIRTEFPENNTVYVKHFRLKPDMRNRPVIVVVNGLHVDAAFDFYFNWWCLRFAAWGFDSVVITIPYSQARTPKGSFSGQFIITPETNWTLLSVRQTFQDIQLVVNHLKASGAGPVGLFGVSYGGVMAGIYACNADNADFSILCMPPVDMVNLFSNWDFTEELRARESRGETTLLTDPRISALMSLRCMKPKIPTNKIFLAAGEFDHLVPLKTIEETHRAWGDMPWLKIYPTGHINTFALNFRMINDLRIFLKEEIL